MGKIKTFKHQIDELINDVYLFGDFHSEDTFKDSVYNRMKENGIPFMFVDYIDEEIRKYIEA